MIVVTGGAGFIGSAIVWELNQRGEEEIIIVDELRSGEKWKNLNGLKFIDIYHKHEFIDLIIEDAIPYEIESIIHMGACSSTTENDADYLLQNNYNYSQDLAKYALTHKVRFIYASSAATYGDGSKGYDDDSKLIDLRPLNMYGYSKHLFDSWLHRMGMNEEIVGLKFFNVYGPNEYHKGDMRSVVHKAFEQIKETGSVNLFKSYKAEYKDGEQLRDFIYIKDAVNMILYFLENKTKNGLFNIGTGQARSWNDLVNSIFKAVDKDTNINYIEMPAELQGKYQYFTQANLKKMKDAGYDKPTMTLEEGIKDYIENYLEKDKYLGY
ncbi:MAG: ADP-glyceromanno-heptose 6-epimerase [Bacteroidetes bacterium]|nr:ADP-glyceromanno-heptose 6-epimerase [Bacteroidota bacterium]MBU1679459.1 ADP-glyceromanno-heptose 6-epimerase [Bacteroidota bacterium]MBU2508568.1 ADP-glyceromanno-heptose 6-epimerase [Bacteroidota bacterium]